MRTSVDIELAKRAAKRLGRLPPFWETSYTERLNLTAIVLGFEHWHSLATNAGKGDRTPLDEELDAAPLLVRQNLQASRLQNARPQLRDVLAVITVWQPSAGNPEARLPSLNEIKPVIQAKQAFFGQGMQRAYIIFFREMLDWPLANINLAAKEREPLAYTVSSTFELSIPLLAPAALANDPTGFEPSDLRKLEASYPDGALALLAEPLVDRTPDGLHWFTPGALVMDGQSTNITLRAGIASIDDLLDIRRDPDGYRVKQFDDFGRWSARTFAQCRHPKWQLDNDFADMGKT